MKPSIAKKRDEGQAAVETAIVMPLMIFIILGIFQWTLVMHARAFTKYAAYRAARAGALWHACQEPMTRAALGALVPVTANGVFFPKIESGTDYAARLAAITVVNPSIYPDDMLVRLAEVKICGPVRGELSPKGVTTNIIDNKEVDFDDPQNVETDQWGTDNEKAYLASSRTRLRVQVVFYYRLLIPFANWVIFEIGAGWKLPDYLRMGTTASTSPGFNIGLAPPTLPSLDNILTPVAKRSGNNYYLRLTASYAMRMQSNYFLSQCPLPENNECFHYWASPNIRVSTGPGT